MEQIIFRKIVLTIFLLLLILGQIPGLILQVNFGLPYRLHPVDLFVLLIAIYTFYKIIRKKYAVPKLTIPLFEFVVVGIISTIITPLVFEFEIELTNVIFALRLLFYSLFIVYFYNSNLSFSFINKTIAVVIGLLSVLGLIQYSISPDMRWLAGLGWDDHYYRMISTFLDPAFLGLVFVIGIIISIRLKNVWLLTLLTFSLALTYSRASWLSLVVVMSMFLFKKYRISQTIICLVLLALSVFILPNPGGEGVNLYRTNSAEQKFENSLHSIKIISASPLIGWGTGNICNAKDYLKIETASNSCRGLDNSFLFVLASTGIVGAIFFARFILSLVNLKPNPWFGGILAAVGLHTQFTNSLFYPFVMGLLAVLVGTQMKLKESS